MEQINQGAAVKAQAASHRDGFLQSTSVPKVPRKPPQPHNSSSHECSEDTGEVSVPETGLGEASGGDSAEGHC